MCPKAGRGALELAPIRASCVGQVMMQWPMQDVCVLVRVFARATSVAPPNQALNFKLGLAQPKTTMGRLL